METFNDFIKYTQLTRKDSYFLYDSAFAEDTQSSYLVLVAGIEKGSLLGAIDKTLLARQH